MRLSEIASQTTATLATAADRLADLITPTIRLGVTGLSGAGKTVFTTALIHCLTRASPLPPFGELSQLPDFKAYLEPQPSDDIPRFPYEDHLACLRQPDPVWPESTRRISQLRLTLEWEDAGITRGLLGTRSRLHIDIIDYPGEWLGDLALLDLDFDTWSQQTRDAMHRVAAQHPTHDAARRFARIVDEITEECLPSGASITNPTHETGTNESALTRAERHAMAGAAAFTDYLKAADADPVERPMLGPGRFLQPGDLEGSPLLTFFPLPCHSPRSGAGGDYERLQDLLERRYESYKTTVVKPFFERHFAKLDRQIVLVDILGALNGGPASLNALEASLDAVLRAFRPGTNSWLSLVLPRRIDRILFAATKADHLNRANHDRLTRLLDKAVARAQDRTQISGAASKSLALAALRSTTNVAKQRHGENFPCLRGRPENGETVAGITYDGNSEAVIFPGDLPAEPLDAFDPDYTSSTDFSFVRFRPPAGPDGSASNRSQTWPHIGLDDAFGFLIADRLRR